MGVLSIGTSSQSRLMEQLTSKCGVTLMDSQEDLIQGTSMTSAMGLPWTLRETISSLEGLGMSMTMKRPMLMGGAAIWVSYLVVISPSGETVFSGVFGDKEGNNAGEYLTVMRSGDVMIYTDSDTVPGAGFLKLTKTY